MHVSDGEERPREAGDAEAGNSRITIPPGVKSVVRVDPDDPVKKAIESLDLPDAKAVIVVIGAADSLTKDLTEPERVRLQQLFSMGVVPAAVDGDAVLVDGGTRSGVMEMVGRAVADRRMPVTVVGVTPEGAAAEVEEEQGEGEGSILEPNHSHFILVQTDNWGGETATLFRFVEALASSDGDGTSLPVVVLLAGDGQAELLRKKRS